MALKYTSLNSLYARYGEETLKDIARTLSTDNDAVLEARITAIAEGIEQKIDSYISTARKVVIDLANVPPLLVDLTNRMAYYAILLQAQKREPTPLEAQQQSEDMRYLEALGMGKATLGYTANNERIENPNRVAMFAPADDTLSDAAGLL